MTWCGGHHLKSKTSPMVFMLGIKLQCAAELAHVLLNHIHHDIHSQGLSSYMHASYTV